MKRRWIFFHKCVRCVKTTDLLQTICSVSGTGYCNHAFSNIHILPRLFTMKHTFIVGCRGTIVAGDHTTHYCRRRAHHTLLSPENTPHTTVADSRRAHYKLYLLPAIQQYLAHYCDHLSKILLHCNLMAHKIEITFQPTSSVSPNAAASLLNILSWCLCPILKEFEFVMYENELSDFL